MHTLPNPGVLPVSYTNIYSMRESNPRRLLLTDIQFILVVVITGVLAVGLFADNPIPMETTNGRSGLFKGS